MRIQVAFMTAGMLLSGPAAMAAAPVLSGVYAISMTNPCQAKIAVTSISALKAGTIGPIVTSATLGTVAYPGNATGPAVVGVTTNNITYPGPSDTAVKTIDTPQIGDIQESIGTLTFNNATKRVTGTVIQARGSLLNWTGHGGVAITKTTQNQDAAYATTASTFTLGGQTYDAVYANIVGGIAKFVTFMAVKNNCVIHGNVVRQL